MEDLELSHIEVMQENSMTDATLPNELKSKLTSIKMQIGKYANTPTETLKEAIERASANLGHAIMDYVEKDLPEEEVSIPIKPDSPTFPVKEDKPQEQPSQQTAQQQTSAEQKPAETTPQQQPTQQPTEKRSSGGLFDFFGFGN